MSTFPEVTEETIKIGRILSLNDILYVTHCLKCDGYKYGHRIGCCETWGNVEYLLINADKRALIDGEDICLLQSIES